VSHNVGRPGLLTIARCCSICEACGGRPQRAICIAGPNGHVTLCFDCAARWLLQATLDEKGTGIRAFSVVL
jgi:hypothetical protein